MQEILTLEPFEFDVGRWGGSRFKGGDVVDSSGEFRVWDGVDVNEYRTVFGPVFTSAVCFNAEGGVSYLNAASRLLGKRKPDRKGVHEMLIAKQKLWFAHPCVVEWGVWLRDQITTRQLILSSDHAGNVERDAAKVHAKMKLRWYTWLDSVANDAGMLSRSERKRCATAQFKKTEGLKPGGKNRMTVDLTTEASLVGGYLMETVKEACAAPYDVRGGRATFVGCPSGDALSEAFTRLVSGERNVECLYYSDDSCYAIKCVDYDGKVVLLRLNLDISACDGSHFTPVFALAFYMMSGVAFLATVAERLFDQLTWSLLFRVKHAKHGRGARQTLTPSCHRLFSGSVLTTYVNNVANMAIFLSFLLLYNEHLEAALGPPSKAAALDMLIQAADRAGYIVTNEVCECDEQIQFLKRSFTMVEGRAVPWMNLGVWFLKFGTISGDLPGSSKVPLEERARLHNEGVALGRRYDGDHIINDAFQRAHVRCTSTTPIYSDYHGSVGSIGRIPTESLARRYGVRVDELEHLAEIVGASRLGLSVSSEVVRKIIKVDYGF